MSHHSGGGTVINKHAALNAPELHIAIFAFLLHFVWELMQLPLFAGFDDVHYFTVILHCTKATGGDVLISLAAFWSASVVARSRFWFVAVQPPALIIFLASGLLITIVFELLATGPLQRWEYAKAMPLLPFIEVGLSAVAQWIVLPLVQLWFVRRQVLGGWQRS
ncbi:hypothetical protein KEM63_12235 [Halopseudomonas nanhaiensis]|uniref:hypothetical protein n=1 Tax=Halopseudomonas nanhaiensis TaxID=2830842 RepID=UPI001CBC4083|nr:hypothetical protein [Halopseudomonas nanhaiensis]UAW97568.1 hypothetical protein KEM63_12235 [Halopseudomonas nanhaiensis]